MRLDTSVSKRYKLLQNLNGFSNKRNTVQIRGAPGAVTGIRIPTPELKATVLPNGKAGGDWFRKPEDVFEKL